MIVYYRRLKIYDFYASLLKSLILIGSFRPVGTVVLVHFCELEPSDNTEGCVVELPELDETQMYYLPFPVEKQHLKPVDDSILPNDDFSM